ncbi:MAG: 30S ribosomal protein S20 [Candidatus Kapabacteria bacterium]|nr:30S ribosomal protein S20 [Candidatus Kapabacteria bacterium]MCS7169008.1 30S ribosomal protein S20 [Candidatus Kapabacteria bacterium]MDW7997263.1 30S ribosomal protein S20 [Bacteroidota bacterium]MDW8226087.1 30S ribosomal protein S20 [Bacteroidota bacterium]
MPHHRSAKKRVRQSERRRAYNRWNKRLLKEAVKAVYESANPDQAQESLRRAYSVLDKVAARGVIHANAAANRKSRLAHFVQTLRQRLAA